MNDATPDAAAPLTRDELKTLLEGIARERELRQETLALLRGEYAMLEREDEALGQSVARREEISARLAEVHASVSPLAERYRAAAGRFSPRVQQHMEDEAGKQESDNAEIQRLNDVVVLAAGLRRLVELYSAMRESNQRQKAADADVDQDALFRVLAEKNRIMAEVGRVDQVTSPLLSAWKTNRESHAAPAQRVIEELARQAGALLEEVIALEDENRESLEGRRGEKVDELRRVERSRLVHRAYGNAQKPPGENRFLDRSN